MTVTGMGMGTGTERAGQSGQKRTGNRGRERPARSGRAAEEEEKNLYVVKGCKGVLEVLCQGGSQYILAPTIFVMSGTEYWSRR